MSSVPKETEKYVDVNNADQTDPEEEDCVTWVKPTEKSPLINENKEPEKQIKPEKVVEKDVEKDVESGKKVDGEEEGDQKGLIISLITLVGSIPALIGAWCWPALVIGLLSTASVASSARELGHDVSFAVTGAMMIAINVYMFYGAWKKRGHLKSHWKRYGPLYFTIFAGFLIMADLTRHLLLDQGVWSPGPWPGGSEYRDDCDAENVTCLSVIGFIFTVICTYSGFIFLFTGTMWNANLWVKLKQIKRKWQVIRAQNKKKNANK